MKREILDAVKRWYQYDWLVHGSRYEYELTPKGKDLTTVMTALLQDSGKAFAGSRMRSEGGQKTPRAHGYDARHRQDRRSRFHSEEARRADGRGIRPYEEALWIGVGDRPSSSPL
jgi:hypothetical protein